MNILVINGPNLNLLGIREPELYGNKSYADLVDHCKSVAQKSNVTIDVRQTNHEGVIVDWVQDAAGVFDAIVINAAAYTHTSIAIMDALKAVGLPVVEVHLTDIKERENFRQVSYIGMVAEKTFLGMGFASYTSAIEYFAKRGL